MSDTVTATNGALLPLDSLTQTIGYTGSFVTTITVSYQGITYIQSLTNDGTNITTVSNWVAQS